MTFDINRQSEKIRKYNTFDGKSPTRRNALGCMIVLCILAALAATVVMIIIMEFMIPVDIPSVGEQIL